MSDVICAGADVLSIELDMPIRGAWTATIEAASEVVPSGRVTITFSRADGGSDSFSGTVLFGQPWQGRVQYEVVAGAGRMSDEIGPLNYAASPLPVPASLIAEAILGDSGETFADGAIATLAAFLLGRRGGAKSTRGKMLTRLCDGVGMNWRMNSAGEIQVGAETYPESDEEPFRVDPGDVGASKIIHVAPDSATLRPGVTLYNRQIHRVRYSVSDIIRAELHYL